MEECFARWAAVCGLKSSAPDLFIKEESFYQLCESTLKLIQRKKFVSDTFFVVFVNGLRRILVCDFPQHTQAIYFLYEVIISTDLHVSERASLIQSTKKFIKPIIFFSYIKKILIKSITGVIDCADPDVNEIVRLLQVLEIIISGVTDSSSILALVYTPYSDLEEVGPEYFDNLKLSPAYIGSLLNRKRDKNRITRDSTISAFISEQVKSTCPVCRRYAYRILGLIAMRCFDALGEKVVGHLLLKKRTQEVPENRTTITVILWNLLFIWPEYLEHVLLLPDFVTPKYGESATVGSDSLLIDLWDGSHSVPQKTNTQSLVSSTKTNMESNGPKNSSSERAVSLLSIARIIAAKRLATQQMTMSVVREIVLSLISRSTVAIAIGTSVGDMRLKQNISDDVPKSKKKKQKKGNEDGTSSSSSATASDSKTSAPALEDVIFKPSILNIIDEDDYAVIRELIAGGVGCNALQRSTRMEVLVEALAVSLGFSVEVSVVKIGRRGTSAWSDTATQRDSDSGKRDICPDVNMMHFERTVALYSSMIIQMFLCRNETEAIDVSLCGTPAFRMWYENQEIARDEATVDSLFEVFSHSLEV